MVNKIAPFSIPTNRIKKIKDFIIKFVSVHFGSYNLLSLCLKIGVFCFWFVNTKLRRIPPTFLPLNIVTSTIKIGGHEILTDK